MATATQSNGDRGFDAGASAVGIYRLVSLDANGDVIHTAAADTDCVGTCQYAAAATERTTVRLLNQGGTHIMVASGIIGIGAVVNQDAAGKVQTGAGTVKVGTAVTAAGADGDWIEVHVDR